MAHPGHCSALYHRGQTRSQMDGKQGTIWSQQSFDGLQLCACPSLCLYVLGGTRISLNFTHIYIIYNIFIPKQVHDLIAP